MPKFIFDLANRIASFYSVDIFSVNKTLKNTEKSLLTHEDFLYIYNMFVQFVCLPSNIKGLL